MKHRELSESAVGEEEPWSNILSQKQIVLTMAGIMLALFLASLDQTVVTTALPQIVSDLGGFSKLTWVTSSYLVASTTVVPITGRLTDIYGRKKFFVGGVLVFLLGSVLSGQSETMNQLIIFRAIQGLGGGIIMGLTFVIIGDLFAPEDRGKYMGFLTAVFGITSLIGPTLGGFITDVLSWQWIFYINVPLAVLILVVLVRYFPDFKPAGPKESIDLWGLTFLILTVVPLMIGLSWAGYQYPWISVQVLGLIIASSVFGILFILIEMRSQSPLIPLTLFRNRNVSISMAAVFLTGFVMFASPVFIPLFFQGVLGRSATSSGNLLTPMMLAIVLGAALSGQLMSSRFGKEHRLFGLVGLGLMGAGTFLVATVGPDTEYLAVISFMGVMGFGLGITLPLFTLIVINSIPIRLMGVAGSTVQFFRTIGGTVGLSLLGAFFNNNFAANVSNSTTSEIRGVLGLGGLEALTDNSRLLIGSDANDIQSYLVDLGTDIDPGISGQIADILKTSLSSAISEIFIISAFVVALAMVVTIFLVPTPGIAGKETSKTDRG